MDPVTQRSSPLVWDHTPVFDPPVADKDPLLASKLLYSDSIGKAGGTRDDLIHPPNSKPELDTPPFNLSTLKKDDLDLLRSIIAGHIAQHENRKHTSQLNITDWEVHQRVHEKTRSDLKTKGDELFNKDLLLWINSALHVTAVGAAASLSALTTMAIIHFTGNFSLAFKVAMEMLGSGLAISSGASTAMEGIFTYKNSKTEGEIGEIQFDRKKTNEAIGVIMDQLSKDFAAIHVSMAQLIEIANNHYEMSRSLVR